MMPGEEYTTLERYKGEVVYAKLVTQEFTSTIGSANGSTDVTIPHGISNLKETIRWTGTDGTYTYPYFTSSGGMIVVKAVASAGIILRCLNAQRDASASDPLTLSFILYYTKSA
jgi:hypothetical protein